MAKTTNSSEISSLSEMLDNVSIDELKNYIGKLEEFKDTVDSLIKEKELLTEKIESAETNIKNVEKEIDEKIDLMNKYGNALKTLSDEGIAKITDTTDKNLKSMDKDFKNKLEAIQEHEDEIKKTSKKLEKDFNEKYETVQQTIIDIKDKTDTRINDNQKNLNSKIRSVENSVNKKVEEINDNMKGELSSVAKHMKDIITSVKEETIQRETKDNNIITALVVVSAIMFICSIILFAR